MSTKTYISFGLDEADLATKYSNKTLHNKMLHVLPKGI